MAGAATQQKDLSDGELSDDDGGDEDLDTSVCKTCNLTFSNPKAFYHHIYSVSHLQKTSNLTSTSPPQKSDNAPSAPKSSFPMEALCVTKSFLSPVTIPQDEEPVYDMQWIHLEPLVEGRWVMNNKKSEDSGMLYSCETCGVSYKEKLLIDLHLAGQRHTKNVEGTVVECSAGEEESLMQASGSKTTEINDMSNIVERNLKLFRQLNETAETDKSAKTEPVDVPDKKLNVADILSRNFNVFEKLSVYVEPVLGVDYISEFRFLNGHSEYVCNLCELTLRAPVSLTEHASSLKHLLRFIFYHELSSFNLISLADKCGDLEYVRNVAADIESKQGRQLRTRVFVESSASDPGKEDSDSSSSQWEEQKDDRIGPIADLPGHTANAKYGFKRPPDETTSVTDVQSLLDRLSNQSCVARGLPPSSAKPVSRMDLLASLNPWNPFTAVKPQLLSTWNEETKQFLLMDVMSVAEFEIRTNNDAEVSLQIANALTLSLLSYRMKMVPALKPSDRTKLEQKLAKLQEEGQLVSEKTRSRGVTVDQDPALS